MRGDFPEFRDWSIAAVRLLQGVVEQEDGRVWNLLLSTKPFRSCSQLLTRARATNCFMTHFPCDSTRNKRLALPMIPTAALLTDQRQFHRSLR